MYSITRIKLKPQKVKFSSVLLSNAIRSSAEYTLFGRFKFADWGSNGSGRSTEKATSQKL